MMQSRRSGDVRNRSPPVNTRDRRVNGHYPEPYPPRRSDDAREDRRYPSRRSDDAREDRPYPPRRSDDAREDRPSRHLQRSSPPGLERSHRILGGRRSTSVERRDHSRYLNGDREDRVSSRAAQLEQPWNRRSQFDGELPHRGSSSMDYHSKYRIPERADLTGDANTSSKKYDLDNNISRTGKEKEFLGMGSSFINGNGMLVQKPVYMEDGTRGAFSTLPLDSGLALNSAKINSNFLPSSSGNLNVVPHKDDDVRYRDQLQRTKIPTRETYQETRPTLYPRDVSYPVSPHSRSKTLQSTSSGRAKEDYLGSYQGNLPLPPNGVGRDSGKYTGELGRDANNRSLYFNSAGDPKGSVAYHRDPPFSVSSLAGVHQDLSCPEQERRKEINPRYTTSDELYREIHRTTQGDCADREVSRPSYMDPEGNRFDDPKSSHRGLRESGLSDHHSLQGQRVPHYLDTRNALSSAQGREYLGGGSNHFEFGVGVSSKHEMTNLRDDYGFERDVAPHSYQEKLSAPMSQHELDIYRFDLSPQRRVREEELGVYDSSEMVPRKKYINVMDEVREEELGIYDSSGRVLKRKYNMNDEVSRYNCNTPISSGRGITRQVQELSTSDEHRNGDNGTGLSLSKRLNFSHRQNRKTGRLHDRIADHRVSAYGNNFSSKDVSVHVQQHAAKPRISVKRRLKPPLVNQYTYRLERRQDSYKPYKFRRRCLEDSYDIVSAQNDDPLEDQVAPVKSDMPEDSEEFKQMVHRAFLRFSKQLNDDPAHRKRYKEQGTAGTMLCSVCGSLSKAFSDTQSLAAHAGKSLKVGLRVDHLGFHKALCVLMGWNADLPPGRALPEAEAWALKEDLVLWPPLVIIHNTSIGYKNPDGRKVVTIEEMDDILQDFRFDSGKFKVCRGKPANQSIMVVKFMPTFSGFQEAERLHKYFIENKRGRSEYLQINGECSQGATGLQTDSADLFLYGYLGISEDLDKLDFETKKKCVVRSKKDIQAIADAPLKDENARLHV